MKRSHIFPVAMIVLCGVAAVSAQDGHFGLPFLVAIGDKRGFMEANCHMVSSAQYSEALAFSEGLAAVKIGEKWGYIDVQGSVVIPPKFAGAWFFSDGLASVKLSERSPLWGFIDKEGNVFGLFDGVEIGDDGNSNPVISGDMVIAGKNDAWFAWVATAKLEGRGGADIGEIDGGVACAAKRAIHAIRFFEQNGDIGTRDGCERGEREQGEACGEFEYGAHEFEPISNTTI